MSSKILNLTDPPNGLKEQIGNAGIMAGLTFFTTVGADLGTGGDYTKPLTWIKAAIAAGATFFGSLVIQRGLVKPE